MADDRLEALRRRDIRHSPDDPAYAVEALRQAWRRSDHHEAERILGTMPSDEATCDRFRRMMMKAVYDTMM